MAFGFSGARNIQVQLLQADSLLYGLRSRMDNRQKSIIPILLYYNRIDGSDDLTVPCHTIPPDEGSSVRSLFYLVWWGGPLPGAE
jgi:hypothetical protein